MTVSYLEHQSFACSVCGTALEAEVWLILDVAEHPEQLEALHQGTLNRTICPQCGASNGERWPFLFHDQSRRCLLLALPPGTTEEHRWREQVRDLHARLMAHIPPEQRWAYQGEVQVVQGLAGVVHALKKQSRWQGWQNPQASGGENHESGIIRVPARAPHSRHSARDSQLSIAIETLMGADSSGEFRAIVEHYPVLLEPEADQALKELADRVFEQRAYEIARCLAQARQFLAALRAGGSARSSERPGEAGGSGSEPPDETNIPDDIYLALAQTRSLEDLQHLVQQYPVFLETRMDGPLDRRIDQALEEGDEHLALILQHRHEQIIELRESIQNGLNYDQTHASVPIP
ncbi:MAG: hypothetical protein HC884_13640 [Chloroflexaceae bacterium]|nr:hypothetical protein [Chloroflexaceae bacterium]